jgi:hypothetical protein
MPRLTDQTDEERAKQVEEYFSSYVNNMSHDPELLVRLITTEHRTLQQSMFNVMMKCIEKWAEDYRKDSYDLRNEYTCKISEYIMKALEDRDVTYHGKWNGVPLI